MDYFKLLHKAQMNNKSLTAQETRCYKATFTAPKKSDKGRVSSDNIKKFLARKEEEERRKKDEEAKKKDELLALRAMDKKAQKRVQVMLKRTKSANKSVMEDAIDNYNTKVTLDGPRQCDEDDYGYVSQEASALYERLMAKYEKDPVDNPMGTTTAAGGVKDLQAAKDRVKAALDREEEEKLHPTRKRKKKHQEDEESNEGLNFQPPSRDMETPDLPPPPPDKPKKIPKKMPPPVDFFELMKIAAKKQHEPILIEKKVEEKVERPMTKKEKLEKQRELERKNRKNNPEKSNSETRVPPTRPTDDTPSGSKNPVKQKNDESDSRSSVQDKKKELKIPKIDRIPKVPSATTKTTESQEHKKHNAQPLDFKSKPRIDAPSKTSQPHPKPKAKPDSEPVQPKVDVSDIDKEIELLMKKKRMLMEAAKDRARQPAKPVSREADQKTAVSKPVVTPAKRPDVKNSSAVKESEKSRTDKIPPRADNNRVPTKNCNDRERTGLSKTDKTPQQKQFAPRYMPPTKRPGQPPPSHTLKKNKRVLDSESEYDSEMDDFIDDGPEDEEDYSSHIKEIFGYDKSRYRAVDMEECQEASYRTQMMEERRSALIGLQEDLEDIQREKEEKARAKARKQSKGRR